MKNRGDTLFLILIGLIVFPAMVYFSIYTKKIHFRTCLASGQSQTDCFLSVMTK